jgi:hypothetical protein
MISPALATAPSRDPARIIGMAALVRLAYEGGNLAGVWEGLLRRVRGDATDAAALMDMSLMLQTSGQRDKALELQQAALQMRRCYRRPPERDEGLRVVAFVTAGDLMANTPIDFLLEGSNADLWMVYVDADTPDLRDLPDHDVAFVAVGESQANRPVLDNLKRLLGGWKGPILNNAPERIAALTREGVAAMFAGEPSILVAPTIPADRTTLQLLAQGLIPRSVLFPSQTLPIIVRPLGSHAGLGMQKVESLAALAAFLAERGEQQFYVTPFIDYSGSDGLFRKQRIAFINGQAYASHCATSDHWMVHYLSAGMAENAARRSEEAAWMADFDADFAVRHAHAFDALYRRIGLDYFAIDCAEMPDGRLLAFEVDVAMIVHAMDCEATFPYKKPAMRKLFGAFQRALQQRCDRQNSRTGVVCAHTGRPAVYQRTPDDCMICVLAMLTGRTYEEVIAAAVGRDATFPPGGPMSHSMMRAVANAFGFVLLSGIYMLWDKPAILGVLSPTTLDTGHAVFWDGEKIIDPGRSWRVDRAYVDRHALEFTQRARDLQPLIAHELKLASAASTDRPTKTV